MSVTELSYVGLNSTDPEGWATVLTEIVGLQKVNGAEAGSTRFRMDERSYRVFVDHADQDSLQVMGWSVESLESLDELSERIIAAGAAVHEADPQLVALRGARAIRTFKDASDFQIELSFGSPATAAPFVPGRPMSGFKTGALGLGHVVLHCKNYKENVDFYREALGFRISDYIVWADADAAFMRCNARHHSLAIINEALGMAAGSLNHIQFEVNSLKDVGSAYDIVLERELPVIMTLGQHTNDMMTSFYFVAPGGVGIEVGWDGRTVDDETAWQITKYDDTKIWGHHMQ